MFPIESYPHNNRAPIDRRTPSRLLLGSSRTMESRPPTRTAKPYAPQNPEREREREEKACTDLPRSDRIWGDRSRGGEIDADGGGGPPPGRAEEEASRDTEAKWARGSGRDADGNVLYYFRSLLSPQSSREG